MVDKNHINHIIHEYFSREHILINHHIESYNDFVLNKIPQTFKQYNPQIIFKEYFPYKLINSKIKSHSI